MPEYKLTLEEQEANILRTAKAMEIVLKTEGWKYIQDYIAVRVELLKNELAGMNLGNSLQVKFTEKNLPEISLGDNIAEAAKKQGEIIGLRRPLGRINHILFKAKQIEEKNKEEKLKEKKGGKK